MRIFLGIGAGPIQTGIFVAGAAASGYDRIVLADVDAELVQAVRQSGTITINTAECEAIRTDTYQKIEIYNPQIESDLKQLIEIAQSALVIATALPSTAFFRHLKWLREAFTSKPDQQRYVYAAENSTTAAAELRTAVGDFPQTYYLDTVIGKMSKIFTTDECDLPPLAPGLRRGHLVEAFNTIYTDNAPGLEAAAIAGLYPKDDLEPFEEAKLYGHNAVHFLLGKLASAKGCRYLSEVKKYPELLRQARLGLRDECGPALCQKYAGVDSFFTPEEFNQYADSLLARMISPILNDSVERIIRDEERKLGWNDRIIGAIRLCLSQNIHPTALACAVTLTPAICEKWKQDANYTQVEGMAVTCAIRQAEPYGFAGAAAEHFRSYVADMEQIVYARMSTLSEGDGRGNRIIEVNNGSGLSFTVVPDRGMDIVEASFRGLPLAFRAPAGHVNPAKFDASGFGWLRCWAGGLLTTCGLRHVGAPEEDAHNPLEPHLGLHGRISAQSAEDVGIVRNWQDNRYEITLSGKLRQAMMFGENIRLHRKISTTLGDNTIYLEDRVTNLGNAPEHIQILYHCNFGYPAITPGTRLETVEHLVKPRNADTVPGLGCWNTLPEPQPGIVEQCFLHTIPPAKDGWSEIALINEASRLKITLKYDAATLPNLMQWKLPESGRYVLGLEPTNTTVSGRKQDIASGVAPVLASGESLTFRLCLNFAAL